MLEWSAEIDEGGAGASKSVLSRGAAESCVEGVVGSMVGGMLSGVDLDKSRRASSFVNLDNVLALQILISGRELSRRKSGAQDGG